MSERKEFEMTEDEHATLLEACRPMPYMVFGGMEPPTTQEMANHAWESLGRSRGFEWRTVEAVPGKSNYFFTAVVK